MPANDLHNGLYQWDDFLSDCSLASHPELSERWQDISDSDHRGDGLPNLDSHYNLFIFQAADHLVRVSLPAETELAEDQSDPGQIRAVLARIGEG